MARQSIRIALEELTRRLEDLRLEDGTEIHFHSTPTRAPLRLPITFTPGPRLRPAAEQTPLRRPGQTV